MGDEIFRIGLNAARAEHRSTDVHGRPVDTSAETPTQRDERVRALQDRWSPHEVPSAEPHDVLAAWMAQSPDNRTSLFAKHLAEHPEWLPEMDIEPGPGELPRPGGLVEKLGAQVAARRQALARRARNGA